MSVSVNQHVCMILPWSLILLGVIVRGQNGLRSMSPTEHAGKELPGLNLEELQKSYMKAYPQSIPFFRTWNSSRTGVNRVSGAELTRSSCVQVNQMRELPELIVDMVTNPIARLYAGENYTGEFEDYSFSTASYKWGCHDLESLKGKVKSVETYGKCIRLFLGDMCIGWSLAVYPGSGSSHSTLNDKLPEVESIGPCLPDEFRSSFFKYEKVQIVLKNASNVRHSVPDLVEFFSFKVVNAIKLQSGSITQYGVGPGNRVEFLLAKITSSNFNVRPPIFNIEESEFYRSLNKEDADVLCFAIPVSIGGPTNETCNIFPANPASAEKWTQLISQLPHPTYMSNVVSLNFEYESDAVTRPFAFNYFINIRNEEVLYGRIVN